ncbi:hypothetical protein K488DRAFT_86849 [Vararia minispora EC-137]|uniref:Uncharacterized protein n=1 Tax=Vararia minispora EC-137 TaxID=1314806 RepID=A0ACB8QJB6_9AGAM|nr:hypothetical protein K488DRAFT_86849 [Vararia minispora EC-137]
MTTQLLSYKPDPSKAAPPDPHCVLAPYMSRLTEENERYTVWEQNRIKEFLAAQPDPRERDSETTQNEIKMSLRRYSQRIKTILAATSRLDVVNDEHRANLACVLAEAVYKTKIFACRIMDINQFPTEILSQILETAAMTPPTKIMTARFTLTWVCRRWRPIIIANQCLWAALNINDVRALKHPSLPASSPASKMPPFSRTSEILERAGSYPLQIRICDPPTQQTDPGPGGIPLSAAVPRSYMSEVIEELMDIILPRLDRLAQFIVVVKELEPILTLLERLHRAPQTPILLERFELHRTGSLQHYGDGNSPWSRFQHAFALCDGRLTSLKVLTLNGLHVDWTATPLPDLRLLDVRRIKPERAPALPDLRYILSNAPLLHTLLLHSLELTSFDPMVLINSEPYHLPRLRSLALGGITLNQALCVLQSVNASGLIELSIRCNSHPAASSLSTPIFDALIGKFPNVRILHLANFLNAPSPLNQATATIGRWLASMPLVEMLRAESVAVPFLSNFLLADGRFCMDPSSPTTVAEREAIEAAHPHPQWVLPRLTCILAGEVDLNALVMLLQRRRAIGHPIKRVYVTCQWIERPEISNAHREVMLTLTDVKYIKSTGYKMREEELVWEGVNEADARIR